MNIRITISKETVNGLVTALKRAYKSGDARMVQRINVLLDYSRGESMEVIVARHEVSTSIQLDQNVTGGGCSGLEATLERRASIQIDQEREAGIRRTD